MQTLCQITSYWLNAQTLNKARRCGRTEAAQRALATLRFMAQHTRLPSLRRAASATIQLSSSRVATEPSIVEAAPMTFFMTDEEAHALADIFARTEIGDETALMSAADCKTLWNIIGDIISRSNP